MVPLRGSRIRELENRYNGIVWGMVWDSSKAIDIGEWLICGGGRLEVLQKYTHTYTLTNTYTCERARM